MKVGASPRFPLVDLSTASRAQKDLAHEISSGPRKGLFGPFIPLLHAPALAARIHKVGEYLRYESSLPKDILECAILTVASRWQSKFEWDHHAPIALSAGVPEMTLAAIKSGDPAVELPQPYDLIVRFCRDALDSGKVDDAEFSKARESYGLNGVLELLTVCGYYSTLAMYLATAEIE